MTGFYSNVSRNTDGNMRFAMFYFSANSLLPKITIYLFIQTQSKPIGYFIFTKVQSRKKYVVF